MTIYRTTLGPGPWRSFLALAVIDAIEAGGTGREIELKASPG